MTNRVVANKFVRPRVITVVGPLPTRPAALPAPLTREMAAPSASTQVAAPAGEQQTQRVEQRALDLERQLATAQAVIRAQQRQLDSERIRNARLPRQLELRINILVFSAAVWPLREEPAPSRRVIEVPNTAERAEPGSEVAP